MGQSCCGGEESGSRVGANNPPFVMKLQRMGHPLFGRLSLGLVLMGHLCFFRVDQFMDCRPVWLMGATCGVW